MFSIPESRVVLPFRPAQVMSSLPPIVKEPLASPSVPEHGAAFIFLHGLGDDGHGWESKLSETVQTRLVDLVNLVLTPEP